MDSSLNGTRVLIVEDEYFLAQQLAAAFREAGAEVLGPVPTTEAALKLVQRQRPDAAVLDIHLGGDTVYPVADLLSRRAVPFFFATGYDIAAIPDRFAAFRVYEKPFPAVDIAAAMGKALEQWMAAVGPEFSYSITEGNGVWHWEARKFKVPIHAGTSPTRALARVAAFCAAMKPPH